MNFSPSGTGPSKHGVATWAFNALAALLLVAVVPFPHTLKAAEPFTIAAFGDSLTAGYGLAPEDSFPTQLEAALTRPDRPVRVINAGVSGDTTAGGAARLGWTLADEPDLVLVALGANDMLRGLSPQNAAQNLDQILTQLAAAEVPAVLIGMRASRNLDAAYRSAFEAIYPDLAAKHDVPLVPFFLDGVALDPDLNQADGIHPNAAGVAVMVKTVLPIIAPLLPEPGS